MGEHRRGLGGPLAQVVAQIPEPPERAGEAQPDVDLTTFLLAPSEGDAQVIALDFEVIEPGAASGAGEMGLRGLGKAEKIPGVRATRGGILRGRAKLLASV